MGSTPAGIVGHFFRNGIIVSAIGLAIELPITIAGIRVVKASVLGLTLEGVAAVAVVVPVLVAVRGWRVGCRRDGRAALIR